MKILANLKVNASIIPTRDYQPFLSKKKLKAGSTYIVVGFRRGLFGEPIRISVRDPKTGAYIRDVPAEVFAL
jgi:hypothetical protein